MKNTLNADSFVNDESHTELTLLEEELLEVKIYQPYFLSNNTIIQFDR